MLSLSVLNQGGSEATEVPQAVLTISQLMLFNCKRNPQQKAPSQPVNTSIPIPLYIALNLHSRTQSKFLVSLFNKLGLCNNYQNVLAICNQVGNTIVSKMVEDECATGLAKPNYGTFTTFGVDNIDYNPSSNTAMYSFHGTAVTITQHIDESVTDSATLNWINTNESKTRIKSLPEWYTEIKPFELPKNKKSCQPTDLSNEKFTTYGNELQKSVEAEYSWLDTVSTFLFQPAVEVLNWSAFHANQQRSEPLQPCQTGLLPLFKEKSTNPATLKHCIDVIKNTTNKLNPGQVPVIVADCPIYALFKQIQLSCPEYNESNFVCFFGGLHLEKNCLQLLGDLLRGSEWDLALTNAGIASKGVAESYLKATHIVRSRLAHQVTLAALQYLLEEAYINSNCDMSFDEWKITQKTLPQFSYWFIIMELQIHIFSLIRSIREHDFPLYVATLKYLIPWMFALNHINYARWLPFHVKDLEELPHTHPEIYKEFMAGKFTAQKTGKRFSTIALDQIHEQENVAIKGISGATSLLSIDNSLKRWMVTSPILSSLLQSFEQTQLKSMHNDELHHNENAADNFNFKEKVEKLVCQIREYGNPFSDKEPCMLTLVNRYEVEKSVVESYEALYDTGYEQYMNYVENVFKQRSDPLTPIKLNKHKLLNSLKERKSQRTRPTIARKNEELFLKLMIHMQTRNSGFGTFFHHESNDFPASISVNNEIRLGKKSQILEKLIPENETEFMWDDAKDMCIVYDGAAIVRMLTERLSEQTFEQYRSSFWDYIIKQSKLYSRIDVVFDVYFEKSLKSYTRKARSNNVKLTGVIKFNAHSKLPSNWTGFLSSSDNKSRLFRFLSEANLTNKVNIIVTKDDFVEKSNSNIITTSLKCNHEEADTRMFLHCAHACDYETITIRTVDSDVVVLAMFYFVKLKCSKLWIDFGVGKNRQYIPIHTAYQELGHDLSSSLLFFHAFTGCDTVSAFYGISKKKAWDTWLSSKYFKDITKTFQCLSLPHDTLSPESLSTLEKFTTELYWKDNNAEDINICREMMFSQKGTMPQKLPPTKQALIQHCRRASMQANCWAQAIIPNQVCRNPCEWGWREENGGLIPFWTNLPPAYKLSILKSCSCKKGCKTSSCGCIKAGNNCSTLCACVGKCLNNA